MWPAFNRRHWYGRRASGLAEPPRRGAATSQMRSRSRTLPSLRGGQGSTRNNAWAGFPYTGTMPSSGAGPSVRITDECAAGLPLTELVHPSGSRSSILAGGRPGGAGLGDINHSLETFPAHCHAALLAHLSVWGRLPIGRHSFSEPGLPSHPPRCAPFSLAA
jgi:hypothetical protein